MINKTAFSVICLFIIVYKILQEFDKQSCQNPQTKDVIDEFDLSPSPCEEFETDTKRKKVYQDYNLNTGNNLDNYDFDDADGKFVKENISRDHSDKLQSFPDWKEILGDDLTENKIWWSYDEF